MSVKLKQKTVSNDFLENLIVDSQFSAFFHSSVQYCKRRDACRSLGILWPVVAEERRDPFQGQLHNRVWRYIWTGFIGQAPNGKINHLCIYCRWHCAATFFTNIHLIFFQLCFAYKGMLKDEVGMRFTYQDSKGKTLTLTIKINTIFNKGSKSVLKVLLIYPKCAKTLITYRCSV